MKRSFQKVLLRRLGEFFIPGAVHKPPQSQDFPNRCTFPFLYRPSRNGTNLFFLHLKKPGKAISGAPTERNHVWNLRAGVVA